MISMSGVQIRRPKLIFPIKIFKDLSLHCWSIDRAMITKLTIKHIRSTKEELFTKPTNTEKCVTEKIHITPMIRNMAGLVTTNSNQSVISQDE